jgi:glycosyltransferase involved in cell wall biosynthesis
MMHEPKIPSAQPRQQPSSPAKPRLLHVVTSPMGAETMLRGQLRFFRQGGYEVFVASSPGTGLNRVAAADGVTAFAIPMEREMAPLRDVVSLWKLWRLMRRLRPDICHVGTPKTGLLGGLAALLAGVPRRFYTLHGLRLETTAGWKRAILTAAERISCLLAQRVICVSESLREKVVELRLADESKTRLTGSGSANGVDVSRFVPSSLRQAGSRRVRRTLGLPDQDSVVGFVGRITRDKGIVELIEAFDLLVDRFSGLRLLLAGCFEKSDPLPAWVETSIRANPLIVHTGFLDDPSLLYQLMDVVVLPSYREGFPTVALEAAAAAKPIVATRVTGSCDAVLDGVTGSLVAARDSAALVAAIGALLDDKSRAEQMGLAARGRVMREFPPERVWQGVLALYQEALQVPSSIGQKPFPCVASSLTEPRA